MAKDVPLPGDLLAIDEMEDGDNHEGVIDDTQMGINVRATLIRQRFSGP